MIMYDSQQGASNITLRGLGIALVIATGGTIPTSGPTGPYGMVRLAPAAAVTAVVLAPGVNNGQSITLVNESGGTSTVTFDVAATSNVADGASAIAILTARTFVWDAAAARWFRAA